MYSSKNKSKTLQKQKGITLIALVVTIIVLLILAGVTISAISGDSGILQNAARAKEETEKASDMEKIKLAVAAAQIGENGYQELDQNSLQKAIDNEFSGRDVAVLDNESGVFTVSLDDKIYKIENNEVSELQVDLYINTEEDLREFRDNVNSGNTYEGKYILLTKDITLDTDEDWIPIGYYPQVALTPTSEENKPFSGIFNGQNHSINGINIETEDKVKGFFGLISGAIIENLTIGENNSINGNLGAAGIAGYAYNSSIINCKNYANITAVNLSGGIVGILNGSKCIRSDNFGEIIGTTDIGGITGGCLTNSEILYCTNNAQIQGTNFVAGISGNTQNSKIIASRNISPITKNIEGDHIAGIAGRVQASEITKCYNVGEIKGKDSISGIAAWGYNININNCYNNALISGDTNVSSICGLVSELVNEELGDNYIENCYNSKNITFSTSGGAIANYTSNGETLHCKNNYYLENTVNNSNEASSLDGIDVENIEVMKSLAEKLGQEFKADTNNTNDGYPVLVWQCDPTMGN